MMNLKIYPPPPPPSRSSSKQLELTFSIDDGSGIPKEVKVYVAGKTATLSQIKSAYKSQYPNAKPLAGWKTRNDGKWYENDGVTEASGNYPSGTMLAIGIEPDGSKTVYKASIITAAGKGKIEYLTDSNWNSNNQKLSDILGNAGYTGPDYNPAGSTNPTGLTFKGWAKADAPNTIISNIDSDTTLYNSGTSFVAVYEAEYSIDTGNNSPKPNQKVPVIAPNAGATLKDIFSAAGVTGNVTNPTKTGYVFGGWKVTLPGSKEIFVSSDQINKGIGSAAEIFPPGTSIEPKWVSSSSYGDGGADGGMPLTNLSYPATGDGVTDEGTIIAKGDITKDNSGKILGYVYEVDKSQKIVLVVAKDVIQSGTTDNPAPTRAWSKSSSASYTGLNGTSLLYDAIGNIENGYSAWVNIRNWNTTAQYMNYPAIKTALVYPDKHYDNKFIESNNNPEVDAFVNGADINSRWYLPTISELKMIFEARQDLLNWTKDRHKTVGETTWLSDKTFWSVNVDNAKNGINYPYAKYVKLSDSGVTEGTADKLTNYYVIPVRRFKYQ